MRNMKLIAILLLGFGLLEIEAQHTQKFTDLKGDYLGQTPPGKTPEIFAPGIVSDTSWRVHSQLAISPVGDEIYWSWLSAPEQIYFSKLKNGKWTKPALADFVKDDLTIIHGGATFSPDGEKLFFYSMNHPGGIGLLDAWYVERTDSGWSNPINVGEPYNSIANDRSPIITSNGNAFNMGKNFPSEDFLRFKYSDGKFSDPTPTIICHGFIPYWPIYFSQDESYVIFPADKEGGFGGMDLYISFKTGDDKWGYPINMGDKINTKVSERFPIISPDGKYMFFMRQTETWDIFWVASEIISELKKQSLNN